MYVGFVCFGIEMEANASHVLLKCFFFWIGDNVVVVLVRYEFV